MDEHQIRDGPPAAKKLIKTLSKQIRESSITLYYYLANLLLFILVLAFWLGLVIIASIAMLIFWGDRAFNPTVEDYDLAYLSEEFHS